MPQKRTNTKKRKTSSRSKKPKVYIPAYKIIMLCLAIIVICMTLLLITTLPPKKSVPQIAVNTEVEEEKKSQKPEVEQKQKTNQKSQDSKENSKSSSTPQKIETPQVKQNQVEKNTTTKENSKSQTQNEKNQSNKIQNPPKTAKQTPQSENSKQITEKQNSSSFNFPQAKNNAQLIFVFDDGGQNLQQLKPFLQLPFPITVAVLPKLQHSVEAANQIRRSGNEVILHQPMQSINAKVNPGPGAIKPEMSEDEITSLLFTNLTEIGPVAGINNHEGSAITANANMMATILKVASEEGVYFLDSRTNVETKVPYVASEMGYSYYERNIFLDNVKTRENALTELKKGLAIANKNGSVIMIGHVWSADFLPQLLVEIYPELVKKGYTFSVVSKSNARK